MKDIVWDRLNKMEDLEQRRMLKQLMTGVFLNLVDYQEEMNKKLEQRVFEEIEDWEEQHDVYVTVCHRDEVDPIHEYLYPMIPADIEHRTCDMKEVAARVSSGEEVKLFTVFLECDYMQLQHLMKSNRRFTGKLITATGSKPIQVRLEQSRVYFEEIEKLYQVFQKNSIPWKTVNHPYAAKFFDVILVGCEGDLEAGTDILEITFNLEELEAYKRSDLVPLWNIERLEIKNSGFPLPAGDRVNYEHIISLHDPGKEHGYLVDCNEEDVRYIKRSKEELTVVSPISKSGFWHVLKITQPVPTRMEKMKYPLVSNKRTSHFVGRYARKQGLIIRAKGEIVRLINSFEAAHGLELMEIDICDKASVIGQSYGLNPFISDNVRVEEDKKIMRLQFHSHAQDERYRCIIHDLMSFLVSEVQMFFPEYKCEGEWV